MIAAIKGLEQSVNSLYGLTQILDAALADAYNDIMLLQTEVAYLKQRNASYQVVKSSEAANATSQSQKQEPDKNVRLQLPADTNTKIPVVYGRTTLGGKLVDAELSQNGRQLDLCYTICMKTGTHIDGTQSEITFKNIFWDNQQVQFREDGVTVSQLIDDEGNPDTRVDGKIQIFCYTDGSSVQTYPIGGQVFGDSSGNNLAVDARNVMAGWTTQHFMSDQVFVIIRMLFDPQAGLNRLPNLLFDMNNTLKLPGDVLYDYMTNGVYGPGLTDTNIKVTAS